MAHHVEIGYCVGARLLNSDDRILLLRGIDADSAIGILPIQHPCSQQSVILRLVALFGTHRIEQEADTCHCKVCRGQLELLGDRC